MLRREPEQGCCSKVKCCLCLHLLLQVLLFPVLGEFLEDSSLPYQMNCWFSLATNSHLWIFQQCRNGQTSGHWACLWPPDLRYRSFLLHSTSDLAGCEKTVGQIKIQSTCCLLQSISLVYHIVSFFLSSCCIIFTVEEPVLPDNCLHVLLFCPSLWYDKWCWESHISLCGKIYVRI